MSKTGETKNSILKLLGSGNKTLSEISETLSLAPSTVSQHLQELEAAGAIEEVENEHIRKWKYYKLNPDYKQNANFMGMVNQKVAGNRVFYYIIGLVAIVVVAYFASAYFNPNAPISPSAAGNGSLVNAAFSQASVTYVPLRLTDPPDVPAGTTSLVVTYSSVGVYSERQSGWIYSNVSGTVDLMQLINVSQVIGGVNVSINDTLDSARFNITSAAITINGTMYNVTVPSGQVSAQIIGNNKVNSSNGVLLDFSPTVAAVYTNSSTVFVMLPSLKAVVVPNPSTVYYGQGQFALGNRFLLGSTEKQYLSNYTAGNILIISTQIEAGNGTVTLGVTVKNEGNQSVEVNHIFVFGNETPQVTVNASCMGPLAQHGGGCNYIINQAQVSTGISEHAQSNVHYPAHQHKMDVMTGEASVAAIGVGPVAYTCTQQCAAQANASSAVANGWNASPAWQGAAASEVVSVMPGFIADAWFPNSTYLGSAVANGTIAINNSAFFGLQLPVGSAGQANAQWEGLGQMEFMLPAIAPFRAMLFTVSANGTLSTSLGGPQLPGQGMCIGLAGYNCSGDMSQQQGGYIIAPGESMTFSYAGAIVPENSGLKVSLVPGDTYTVSVQGDGAQAYANVTAS